MQTRQVTAEEFYGPGYDDCDERIPDIGKAAAAAGLDAPHPAGGDVAAHRGRLPRPLRARDALRRRAGQAPERGSRPAMGALAAPGREHLSVGELCGGTRLQRRSPPAGVIDRLLRAAPAGLDRIVVVDDGSRDDTAEVAARLAPSEPRLTWSGGAANGGYGAAMKDGLAAALAAGAQTVACVHADGQYSPEALGRLVRELEARGLDLLQGSRIAAGTALRGRDAPLQIRGQRRPEPAREPDAGSAV